MLWKAARYWHNLGGADRAGDRVLLIGQVVPIGLAWAYVPRAPDPWDLADRRVDPGLGARRELVRGDVERGLHGIETKLECPVCLQAGWV